MKLDLTKLDAMELRLLANYLSERARICGIADVGKAAEIFSQAAADVLRELNRRR